MNNFFEGLGLSVDSKMITYIGIVLCILLVLFALVRILGKKKKKNQPEKIKNEASSPRSRDVHARSESIPDVSAADA